MIAQGRERKSDEKEPPWTVACRDAHLAEVIGDDGKPLDSWSAMKAIGVQGVEASVMIEGFACTGLASSDQPYALADDAGIRRLMDDLGRHKLEITAFCLHNQYDARPDEEVAFTIKCAQIAEKMGVPAIRVDIVPRKYKLEDPAFLENAIRCMKAVVDGTKGLKVRFGVENHGHGTNNPEILRPLFKGVGSDRFGLTLDTGNFYWYGWPLDELYKLYDEFAATACHTHCKSIKYPEDKRNERRPIGWEYGQYNCPIDRGDIDFKKVAAILRKNNYRGDLCIENESLGKFDKAERGKVLKKEADLLHEIARM
jgi:sugar phosphate isomerase/epimerase